MTARERNKLRKLQDKFLNMPDVRRWIAIDGNFHRPILTGHQFSASHLCLYIEPSIEGAIRFHLRSNS